MDYMRSQLKVVFQSMKNGNVTIVGMGRSQGVSLESDGFSDQFYEPVLCMKETKVVCVMNSCNRLGYGL